MIATLNLKEFTSLNFIMWSEKSIIAIDTKGDHLISKDYTTKLFYLDSIGPGKPVKILLVTEGEWDV